MKCKREIITDLTSTGNIKTRKKKMRRENNQEMEESLHKCRQLSRENTQKQDAKDLVNTKEHTYTGLPIQNM